MFDMIHALIDFVFPVMLCSLKISHSFLLLMCLCLQRLFCLNLTPPIDRFKSGLVYERRRPTVPLPEPGPPSEPAHTESSTGDPTTTPVPRRSTKVSRSPDRYGFSHTSLHVTLSSIPVLSSYSEAAKHDCWRAAMIEELWALQDNHTWDFVPCPALVKAIGCKWVYSIKLRSDGNQNFGSV